MVPAAVAVQKLARQGGQSDRATTELAPPQTYPSRIYVRLDALESMVDRRCSELEQRFAEVTNMPGVGGQPRAF